MPDGSSNQEISGYLNRMGTTACSDIYCESAENKTLLNTAIAIPPNYWNKKLNRISDTLPKGFGKADELNKELQRQIRLLISFQRI